MHGNNRTREGLKKYSGALQFIYDPRKATLKLN